MESLTRRRALGIGVLGLAWLSPLATLLAEGAPAPLEQRRDRRAIIVLRLAGGPSQLETFDPHPGRRISGGTRVVPTAAPGISLAEGFERLAERMQDVALVRSVVGREADHERGTYLFRTGSRPSPTVVHPALGALASAALPDDGVLIPRHVSILAPDGAPKGGSLGPAYDAFGIGDPNAPIPDVRARVPPSREEARIADLSVVERAFAERHHVTGDLPATERARSLMRSADLVAFDVSREPRAILRSFGETPFGRGCLAAVRLVERGVRAVEITLPGWDTHSDNHATHRRLASTLDPALSALLVELRRRERLDTTLVLCGGEFGRTPTLNGRGGRDHWPHGFTLLLAGGGIRGGRAIGETDPEGGREVREPKSMADVTATALAALGLDPRAESISPAGRPIRASEGTPIEALIDPQRVPAQKPRT